jgi:2-oxoacid dehydrogenases acyltransferase (catalytic domain)
MPILPLFKRPDGNLVTDESHVRRMIPYLMRGRNESIIFHDELVDLTRTKPWIKEYNRVHKQPVTLFHLFLWAMGTGFYVRNGLNRFISGGRIYQHKGVHLSFAAKKKFNEKSELVTVKLPFFEKEPFADCVRRVLDAIGEGRSGKDAKGEELTVNKELKLAMALPGPLLRFVMACLRGLDRFNLLPGSMIESDPMFTSCFVANLGSVGIDRTYHHLYEYGTASLFCVLGSPRKQVVVGADGKPGVKEMIECRWSFDERINDGFYCAASLRYLSRLVEDPEKYIGLPTANADKDVPAAPAEKPAAEPIRA